jgi:acetyltransferase-like isoleucine patch superfamily enzyme
VNTADVYRLAQRARAKVFSLGLAPSFAEFGPRTVIDPPLRLVGERSIAIGADVYIGAGSWLQVVGPSALTTISPALVIGAGTRMSGTCTVSVAAGVDIGRSVLFARGVYVADHRHAFADIDLPVLEQGIEQVAPVVIGDGAWLGEHVVVCPGVTIGRGAVVGANSVVTADVAPGSVAVGAPARVVRTRARV